MRKTAIGIVTFGNAAFTRLALEEIKRTVTRQVDIVVVIGKPGDTETDRMLHEFSAGLPDGRKVEHISIIPHDENKGFPASINDIYDYVWNGKVYGRRWDYDDLIMMGNDVIPYPNAIDALMEEAERSDYEWISSCQFDVKSLCDRYPAARQYFTGPNYTFTDFTARPWDLHGPEHVRPARVEGGVIKDVHNLCLFKRSVFDKIGYIDVNFFPAYFSDNDYCMRGTFEGLKTCSLDHSAYFHFWSRTIHQGSGGSTPTYFDLNARFYATKWGGPVGQEKWKVPFDGRDFELGNGTLLPGARKISRREDERSIVNWWKALGGGK